MSWFRRTQKGLVAQQKKDLPDGMWLKCEKCREIIYRRDLEENYFVCRFCGFHFRIRAYDYVRLLADEGSFEEFNQHLESVDPLGFRDSKRYSDRLKEAKNSTGMNEAIVTGTARVEGIPYVLGVMDFAFIGGSMGSVVGEKVARAIDRAIELQYPLVIVSASGGARMQEGALSLMQMAKTSARLTLLSEARLPYISVLTHPTTGGVTASYAMLGDVILAEPGALIGFAGPRVIQQTIRQELPEGFQTAEFLLQHGFVDAVVPRKELKARIAQLLRFFGFTPVQQAGEPSFACPEVERQ